MYNIPFPDVPLAGFVEWVVDKIIQIFGPLFTLLANWLEIIIDYIHLSLDAIPWVVFVLVFSVVSWRAKSWKTAMFIAAGLLFVQSLGLWEEMIFTLTLVITSVVISLLIAIPIGILAARISLFYQILRPILDFMQTIPPYVYLIPAVMLFGIGTVPGVIATIVFATPPPVRLTYLGIKEVPKERKEAGQAFGASSWQQLWEIEFPSALSSIMVGINQCIMMSLSMVVIASMIGAGGLGKEVYWALNTVNVGKGFEAGIGIVILAMILDRLIVHD